MTESTYQVDINGTRLWLKHHEIDNPKALIIIVHGYAEYADRYNHVIEFLLSKKYNVIAYDQRNHGRSKGRQAYIENIDAYADDLNEIYATYARSGLKVFLLSHSMGGLVASDFLIRYPTNHISGAIFTAPAIQVPKDLSPLLQKAAGVMGRIAPTLKTVKLDYKYITRDKEILEKYISDPLVYTEGTYAKTGSQLLSKQKRIKEHFYKIKAPIVIFQGTADKLADPAATQSFYEDIGSTDKEIRMLDGWYHEILNEPDRAQVMDSIDSWILERL